MTSIVRNQCIKRVSPLYRLDLFIAEYGIIRVGGKLKRSTYNKNLLHPNCITKGCDHFQENPRMVSVMLVIQADV